MSQPARIENLLGEPYCCEGPCEHRDCKALRADATKRCPLCGKPMVKGDTYTYIGMRGDSALTHYECAMREWLAAVSE